MPIKESTASMPYIIKISIINIYKIKDKEPINSIQYEFKSNEIPSIAFFIIGDVSSDDASSISFVLISSFIIFLLLLEVF